MSTQWRSGAPSVLKGNRAVTMNRSRWPARWLALRARASDSAGKAQPICLLVAAGVLVAFICLGCGMASSEKSGTSTSEKSGSTTSKKSDTSTSEKSSAPDEIGNLIQKLRKLKVGG